MLVDSSNVLILPYHTTDDEMDANVLCFYLHVWIGQCKIHLHYLPITKAVAKSSYLLVTEQIIRFYLPCMQSLQILSLRVMNDYSHNNCSYCSFHKMQTCCQININLQLNKKTKGFYVLKNQVSTRQNRYYLLDSNKSTFCIEEKSYF